MLVVQSVASAYAKFLDVPLVLCHKTRKKANVVADMQIIGDVRDMDVILIDDIVDTAGTITKAAQLMIRQWSTFCPCHGKPLYYVWSC